MTVPPHFVDTVPQGLPHVLPETTVAARSIDRRIRGQSTDGESVNQEPSSQYVENNQGGYVFANQGGQQSIHINAMKDHLQNGLMALKGKLYAKAVEEFENALSAAQKAGADQFADARHDLALGHFSAALAMLNGRP